MALLSYITAFYLLRMFMEDLWRSLFFKGFDGLFQGFLWMNVFVLDNGLNTFRPVVPA